MMKMKRQLAAFPMQHELVGQNKHNSHEGLHLGNFAEKHSWSGSCNPFSLRCAIAGLFL
jgi:hypothetical protein